MGSGKPRIVTTLKKGATKAVNSVALSTVVIIKQQLVLAVDTAINTVETTTQGPTTVEVNRNDTLTIGPAGSIAVAGSSSNGISGTGDSNTITISGSIRAAGECSFAINCLRLGHPFNTLNDLFVGGRMGIGVDGSDATLERSYRYSALACWVATDNPASGQIPYGLNHSTTQAMMVS